MPRSSKEKGASPIIIIVLVLFLAAVGYFVAQNYIVNVKSGASSVVQFATGVLVKNGSPAFAPCTQINAKAQYGLINGSPVSDEGSSNVLAVSTAPVVRGTARPATPPPTKFTPAPTGRPTSLCTILVIQSSLAEPFVGQTVTVTGTVQNGVFYATTISSPNAPRPTPTRVPTTFPSPTRVPAPSTKPSPSPIRTAL